MNGLQRCEQYVDDVLSGRVAAPKTIKQACRRYKKDLKRKDIYIDDYDANGAVENIEMLRHVKGKWRGRPVVLENFQCFAIVNLFGWKWKKSGKRRFRDFYFRIPRKNGKSFLGICIAILLFSCDGEPGAEVYLGATGQGQANDLLFNPAKEMMKICPDFSSALGIEINASNLIIPESFSQLKSVIRKPDDGYNPHGAIVDEYHEHDTDDQWSTFDTGMGARDQPMLGVITTAGANLAGPCKEMDDECIKILDGSIESDTTFVLIYAPNKGMKWDDPKTLMMVNPNIGVSVSEEYLLNQLDKARRSAARQNQFRTKHLNQWVGAKTAWMNMLAWQRQKRARLTIDDYLGEQCHVAVDLASKRDLVAIRIMFFDGEIYRSFGYYFTSEASCDVNDKYRKFELDGYLIVTDGNATDYGAVQDKLLEISKQFDVLSMAFDPFQGPQMMQNLMAEGVNCIEFRNTVQNMSNPMKEIDARVADKRYQHNGDPVMTWAMGNVTARIDAKENIFPRKENENDPRCKIDPVVADIMCMGRWLEEPPPAPSIYETTAL